MPLAPKPHQEVQLRPEGLAPAGRRAIVGSAALLPALFRAAMERGLQTELTGHLRPD